jgi:uncharacterized iron-regulated membrane protein
MRQVALLVKSAVCKGPVVIQGATLYRTLWRWHFYAGLFVIPFILMLSATGAIYLFKPQIDRWEESAFQNLPTGNAVSPNVQLDAALAAFPGARFDSYRLPEQPGDAALIHVGLADGISMRDVFVSPQGKVLGSLDASARWSAFISTIHSTMLLGRAGSWMVELAASWAIVMILSGLYLWLPRGKGLAGVVWPRLSRGKQAFWRDVHAVTGFWISGLALVLLISGMPWAGVWGDAFKLVRAEFGLMQGPQNWKTATEHAEHDHAAMMKMQNAGTSMVALSEMVTRAQREGLPFPTLIRPPGDDPGNDMVWTIKSQAQNRPLNRSITFDMATGKELSRTGFADKHPIDRVVNYGIAWHEGQLFGWVNQLIGVLTALALITMAVSGFILWRRRKPHHLLGAPPQPIAPAKLRTVAAITLILAALLPLLAASLILLCLFERLILPRLPRLSLWLGVMKKPVSP